MTRTYVKTSASDPGRIVHKHVIDMPPAAAAPYRDLPFRVTDEADPMRRTYDALSGEVVESGWYQITDMQLVRLEAQTMRGTPRYTEHVLARCRVVEVAPPS